MKKRPPVRTVLTDAESHEWTGITKDQSHRIMTLLDEWIGRCESKHQWIADKSSGAVPEHQRLAAELQASIAKVKEYRGAIQSDGQAFWALAMLNVARAASLFVTLDRDIDWFLNHDTFRATLKKQQTVAGRRQWLANLIEEDDFTKAEIEGSRLERKTLRLAYQRKWRKCDTTFRNDLKSLGYKPR